MTEVTTCTAPVCREDSRDIPEIGSTGMRKGKQTVTVDGTNLGWTHLNCESGIDASLDGGRQDE